MRIYRAKQLYGPDGVLGVSRAHFYRMRSSGGDKPPEFPEPNVELSERIHGWTDDIVAAWVESKRIDKSQHDVKE